MSDTQMQQIMHTLGEIAAAVWPNSDMPVGIQATLLSRPYDGLRLMREHDNFALVRLDRFFSHRSAGVVAHA